MYKKNEILSNPREFSSEQIAEAIKAGVLTMYELSKSGNLTPLMKKRIEDKLAAGEDASTSTAAVSPQPQPQEGQPKVEIPKVNTPTAKAEMPVQESVPRIEIPEPPSDDGPYVTPPAPPTNNVETQEEEYEYPVIDNRGMFKRPFSFKGRIRRLEFGLSCLIYMVGYAITMALMAVAESNPDGATGLVIIGLISDIVLLWFMLAQGAKRCHDRGNSGWWQIIPFYFYWMLFADGDEFENDYGNNPKD